jgi:glycosyltransferase involved in cell wall biosynthesis
MKIVLINHYAGSPRHGMEFRPYYLSRAWKARGHEVTVIAASHSHLRRENPRIGDETIVEEYIDGIRYVWIATPSYQGNGIGRAINMAAFVTRLLKYWRRVIGERGADAVIASSTYPLDIVAACRLARKSRGGLLFEVHDLWPLSPIELGGMSPSHPFIRVMQWAEDKAYRDADRVVSILPDTLDHMVSRGMAADKFAYIPNGVDASEWDAVPVGLPDEHAATLSQLRAEGKLVIGYAGSHGVANALDTVVDAAAVLEDAPVVFVLVGQGPEKARLMRRVEDMKLDNVRFLPTVSKTCIPTLLGLFDVACFAAQNSPLYAHGISFNKLFDYMMAGRPILQALTASNDLVSASDCGLSVPGEDPAAFAAAVRRFVAMSRTERDSMGGRGREYALKHHVYDILADQFLEVISDARRRSARREF